MRKESIDILNRIKPAIENIIEKECSDIYQENQKLKKDVFNLEQIIKEQNKTKDELEKQKLELQKQIDAQEKVLNKLHEDKIIEIFEDSECSQVDEYWSGWWYNVKGVKYKWEQYVIFHESF